MKTILTLTLSSIILASAAASAVASNDDFHDPSVRAPWLPKPQIEAQLNQMGYRVHRLKADDGCLEAYVSDRNRVRGEVYLDPTTGMPGCHITHGDRDD